MFPIRLNNTLDVLSNDLVERCLPIPGVSGHKAVYGELHLTVKIQPPARRTVYMLQKDNFTVIRQHICNFSASFLGTFSVGLL